MQSKPKVLITGCSSGLGKYLAEKFEEEVIDELIDEGYEQQD